MKTVGDGKSWLIFVFSKQKYTKNAETCREHKEVLNSVINQARGSPNTMDITSRGTS